MIIQIKNWIDDSVLFEHDCIDNSVKITLEKAVQEGANLKYAELNDAKLNYANLNGAKLNYAKLNGAELNDAKLNYANLNGAKLNYAKLNGAELKYAELPKGNIVINDRWHIHIRPNYIRIGCQKKAPSFWQKLSVKAAEKEWGAGDWWKQWKPIVLSIWKSIKNVDVSS